MTGVVGSLSLSLSLGFRSRGFNLSGLKICGQHRGVLEEYHFFVAVAATAATYRRGVVSSASVKDRQPVRFLPTVLHNERITRVHIYIYSYAQTHIYVYVRAGHNSCDINGISIAIWLRAAIRVPSLHSAGLFQALKLEP